MKNPRRTAASELQSPLLTPPASTAVSSPTDSLAHLPEATFEIEMMEDERFAKMSRGEKMIPYILTASDLIALIGAGMTVRFWVLFFIKDYNVSPIGICAIFCLYPLVIAT